MMLNSNLTADIAKLMLTYDQETGNLFWKHRDDMPNSWNARYAHKLAGGAHNQGYTRIVINGTKYLAHRVIWLIYHGSWPTNFIDHINGNRSDNRICNLREATYSENAANTHRHKNKTGYKGVYKWDGDGKHVYYAARIVKNLKVISLGYFATPEEAHDAYCKASIELHGRFSKMR